MSTVFVRQGIWPQLTKAVSGSRQPCAVAVAYFGKGASGLLPLSKGSSLVVDASERAVASGQTCPADLRNMVKRGVTVFSVPNLHAKVFVLDRVAYVGSTNVSNRSANQLVEAVIRTTEPSAVRAARSFVREHCLHELTPELLKRLVKLYRPPQIPGGRRGKKRVKESPDHPTLPRLLFAQLVTEDWSDIDQSLHDSGQTVAKKRLKNPRRFELDSFRWLGNCPYRRGDVVIQVVDEGNGSVLMEVPGNVLHVRTRRDGNKRVSFVYLEQPVRRRRRVKAVAQVLGCAQKRLQRDGVIRDQSFAQALLNMWAVTL
jgi:hypothetical protein